MRNMDQCGGFSSYISRVSCQKGPICHAYAWRIAPFWQDALDIKLVTKTNGLQTAEILRITSNVAHINAIFNVCADISKIF